MSIPTLEQLVDAAGVGRKGILNKSEPNANDPREYTVVLYDSRRENPPLKRREEVTRAQP